MKIKLIFSICLTILLSGCNENRQNDQALYDNNETYSEPESSNTIDWSDGNSYSYDYIETLNLKDSLDNDRVISIYKTNKPSDNDILCEPKICKWCNNSTDASNYTIEEFPDLNWTSGDLSSISYLDLVGLTYAGTSYLDFQNNRLRTEWKVDCEYPGPVGFCSLKCENEYRYR